MGSTLEHNYGHFSHLVYRHLLILREILNLITCTIRHTEYLLSVSLSEQLQESSGIIRKNISLFSNI